MSRAMRLGICVLSMHLIQVGVAFGGNTNQQENASENAYVSKGVNRGEKVKLEGVVVKRKGEIVTVRTEASDNIEVALTDYTKVATPDGLLGKKNMPVSNLIPGLWVKVQGVGDSPGHVLAESLIFSTKDLRTANAIQGGLTPLDNQVQSIQRQTETNVRDISANQQQIQANEQQIQSNQQRIGQTNQRVSELADYNVKFTASVNFQVGSAILSAQAKSELMQLAKNAATLRGYFFQVKGFTDTSGTIGQNQTLSMGRALSVIAFLEQEGNVPLTHILTPGAMGETQPLVSNETPAGRAENRRVEIDVLESRGMAEP